MPYVEISDSDFVSQIADSFSKLRGSPPAVFFTAKAQFSLGIRIEEAIEVQRWTIEISTTGLLANINLCKGDQVRTVNLSLLGLEDLATWFTSPNFPVWFSKGAYLWRLKKVLQHYRSDSDRNRIVSHAFRYAYIKRRYLEGLSLSEIQEEIKHKSLESTKRYLMDKIFVRR